jgi:adenine deaminase
MKISGNVVDVVAGVIYPGTLKVRDGIIMTLAFMALLVIPQLKISDKGLFDSQSCTFTNLFVE